MPAPSFSYEIDVSRLNGEELPDGDKIILTEIGTAQNPSHIAFELELQKDFWWKGLVLFNKTESNDFIEVVAGDWKDLQDKNYSKKTNEIAFSEIEGKYAALSKAKSVGIHSNVYHIANAATALKAGRKYKISWKKQ